MLSHDSVILLEKREDRLGGLDYCFIAAVAALWMKFLPAAETVVSA